VLETAQPFHHIAREKIQRRGGDPVPRSQSVLVQELELVTSAVEITSPSKEEVHTLIGTAPSLRYLSEMNDGQLRSSKTPGTRFTSAGIRSSGS